MDEISNQVYVKMKCKKVKSDEVITHILTVLYNISAFDVYIWIGFKRAIFKTEFPKRPL